jgi:hypothetical protein
MEIKNNLKFHTYFVVIALAIACSLSLLLVNCLENNPLHENFYIILGMKKLK